MQSVIGILIAHKRFLCSFALEVAEAIMQQVDVLHVSVQYVYVNCLSCSAGGTTGQECTGTTDTAPSFLLIRVQSLLGEHHTRENIWAYGIQLQGT